MTCRVNRNLLFTPVEPGLDGVAEHLQIRNCFGASRRCHSGLDARRQGVHVKLGLLNDAPLLLGGEVVSNQLPIDQDVETDMGVSRLCRLDADGKVSGGATAYSVDVLGTKLHARENRPL